jgi:hypothetical protein
MAGRGVMNPAIWCRMATTRALAALAAAFLFAGNPGYAQDKPNRIERTAQKAADATERTAKRAGKFVEKTGRRAGNFVDRTATKTGNAIKRAVE